MTPPVKSGDSLYDCELNIQSMTEYGASLEAALAGQHMPPEGVRIDVVVAGIATGPVLKGKVEAVDYAHIRADGRMHLHIHGTITTEDDAKIALLAEGVLMPRPDDPIFELRESLTLFSSAPNYKWLNSLHLWGEGTVDLPNGKLHISVRVA